MKKILRQLVIAVLNWEAKLYIKRTRPFLILVCGLINRSNVKEDLVQILTANNFKVRSSFKGYNAEIGLPLSILNLEAGFSSLSKWFRLIIKGGQQAIFSSERGEILILEAVVNKQKESVTISNNFLAKITIICDFEANFSQKNTNTFKQLQVNNKLGLFIINSDYPDLAVMGESNNSLVYFGTKQPTTELAENIEETASGQEFIYKNEKISLNKFGVQAIYSWLICQIVLQQLNTNINH